MLAGYSFAAFAQDFNTPYGAWRGQTQYQARVGNVMEQAAHAVVPLVLEIESGGRLRGVSSDNGCKLLGVASPGFSPTMLQLDVTLSGCQYARYNRRYTGTLTVNMPGKHAAFNLRSSEVALGVHPFTADIKATMRR